MNLPSLVLIVAKTAISTSRADMTDIAILVRDVIAPGRDQEKLFPHFGEAGTAVFAIEKVEYGGHDRTSSFDHHPIIISLGAQW